MKRLIPNTAIIDLGNHTKVIYAPTIDDLVMQLFEMEVDTPTTIMTNNNWVHYDDEIYRYCYIKNKITPDELFKAMALKPCEIKSKLNLPA
ncbi:MAG: hypothetical protein RIC03_12580 [Cyclobacteriaceae bacterium]